MLVHSPLLSSKCCNQSEENARSVRPINGVMESFVCIPCPGGNHVLKICPWILMQRPSFGITLVDSSDTTAILQGGLTYLSSHHTILFFCSWLNLVPRHPELEYPVRRAVDHAAEFLKGARGGQTLRLIFACSGSIASLKSSLPAEFNLPKILQRDGFLVG